MSVNTTSFEIRKAKIEKTGNRLLYGFLIIFTVGYIIFFSSNLWMPVAHSDVEITGIGETVSANDRNITLDKWSYSEEDSGFEIIVEIQNLSIDGADRYNWRVRTSTSRYLPVEKVVETPDLVVLHVSNVPRKFAEVKLEMTAKVKGFDTVPIYTSKENMAKEEHLTLKTKADYKKEALAFKVNALTKQAKDLSKEIDNLKAQQKTAESKLTELQNSLSQMTASEKQSTESRISEIASTIDGIKRDIEEKTLKRQELEQKIHMLTGK